MLAIFFTGKSYCQTKYVIDKVAYGSMYADGNSHMNTFEPVIKRYTALLYNDALVFDTPEGSYGANGTFGAGNTIKLVRKIDMNDGRQHWTALDTKDHVCQITITDFKTYSLIEIKNPDAHSIIIYQTL